MIEGAELPALLATLVAVEMLMVGSRPGDFAHFVSGRDHDRAKWRHGVIIQTPPVHRHAKETRCAQGFEVRIQFFQMAAETFLAAYRRLGPVPFKAALYPAEGERNAA